MGTYNPEARVWRGKSYKRGGQSGKHNGTTIAQEREKDRKKNSPDTANLGDALLGMFPDQSGSMTPFKASLEAIEIETVAQFECTCYACGSSIPMRAVAIYQSNMGVRHPTCS